MVVDGERAEVEVVAYLDSAGSGTQTGVAVQGEVSGHGFSVVLEPADPVDPAGGSASGYAAGADLRLVQDQGLQVQVAGFQPASRVGLYLFSDPHLLGEFRLDGQGSLPVTVSDLPDEVTACPHTLQVAGRLPGGSPVAVNLGVWVQAATAAFDDVPAASAHRPAIGCLADQQVVRGYGDGSFLPNRALSRGAAAALLYRLAGSPPVDVSDAAPFVDVPGEHVFADAIAWAAAQDIARGNDDGTFRPDVEVSRGAFAALLYRAAGSPAVDGAPPFVDVEATGTFAVAITWLAQQGVVRGYEDGTFAPQTPPTRGAAATMLVRAEPVTCLASPSGCG
ncbi:MAG: S-layer homology domain-containing protein [Nitriliruptoraceae bacterium]